MHDLLRTLHLLAAVLWVGGMAFAHLFLRPALATLEPPQRLRLMHVVLRRFLAGVGVAVLLLLASGAWMIGRIEMQAARGGADFQWPTSWLLMTGLGLVMSAVYVHVRFVLWRRLAAAVDAEGWPAAAAALAAIRRWVAFNLLLGVVVIVAVGLD